MSESLDTIVTAYVRRADEAFAKVGGSSRHWVRECLFPALEEYGLAVVTIAEREVLAKRVEEYHAALETALVMIENGDFRNGVSEYGVDEGMVGASKMIDELRAVLAKGKP